MNRLIASACAAAVLFAGPGAAEARAPVDGSDYVQCDGAPAFQSVGSLLGQIVMITATAGVVGGIVGAPEVGDTTKRLTGEKGMAACASALGRETNELRRAQLTLARAIHMLEAKQYDAAIAEARSTSTVAGKLAQEKTYGQGLALAALEIEAAALAGLGRPAEAEQTALRMAAAAPYDVLNVLRASPYVNLTDDMSPEKRVFIDRAGRLWPNWLSGAAEARQWAGDYAGSAAAYEAYEQLLRGFTPPKTPATYPAALANVSVAYMMAGDLARSETVARETRTALDQMTRDGSALRAAQAITRAEELLDFQAVGRAMAEGRIAEARTLFAGRSRWTAPTAAAVSDLSARLRAGAAPAQLIGGLVREPAAIRAEALASKLALVVDEKSLTSLHGAIRYIPENALGGASRLVWKVDKSPFMLKRGPKDTYVGEIYDAANYAPQVAGQALLLHVALLAQAQGKAGFVIMPLRERLTVLIARIGDPGDVGLPPAATISAAQVIADLSPSIPEPVKRK